MGKVVKLPVPGDMLSPGDWLRRLAEEADADPEAFAKIAVAHSVEEPPAADDVGYDMRNCTLLEGAGLLTFARARFAHEAMPHEGG